LQQQIPHASDQITAWPIEIAVTTIMIATMIASMNRILATLAVAADTPENPKNPDDNGNLKKD
jgi:hypothetical protein